MRISDWSSDVCSSDLSQINALAAAVRANQEMNERLPSVVMRQVDARLARVERSAPRAVARPYRKAGTPSPKPSPTTTAEGPRPRPHRAPVPDVRTPRGAKAPAGVTSRYPQPPPPPHSGP